MQSAQKSCSKQSSGAGSLSIVSSTLMGGVVIMGLLIWGMENIFRIDHGRNEFANGATHVNGIEGFWGFFKIRLSRFRGMIESTFYLHLKECEFRFHYRDQDTNRWRGYRKTLL